MDTTEEYQRVLKKHKKTYEESKEETREKAKKYVNSLITRILISIILFFIILIASNTNSKVTLFLDEIMSDNMPFTKIKNTYNKYFGSILPFDSIVKDETPVFNESLKFSNIDKYMDGFVLTTENNALVPAFSSGVVVFMGEKEGLGYTIIVQGMDEIDYWYSNIENYSCSLYDYVSTGSTLATVKGNNLYVTFKKDGEYLDYDEVVG